MNTRNSKYERLYFPMEMIDCLGQKNEQAEVVDEEK
jgi:hypothetical protein